MTNLNAIVLQCASCGYLSPLCSYTAIGIKFKGAEYKYISNKTLGFLMGLWGFAFTAFACILGMVPQIDYAQNPSEWWFVLISNIIMPFALLGLGLVPSMDCTKEQNNKHKKATVLSKPSSMRRGLFS